MYRLPVVSVIVVGALLTGCAASPSDDLPPFGSSVRHAMESQVYHPGDRTPGLNGERAVRVMETYRRRGEVDPAPSGLVLEVE